MLTLALILAAPVALVALFWCIVRCGDRETPRPLDATYRQHEGDDVL